jgi:hormone-sensitive lipase
MRVTDRSLTSSTLNVIYDKILPFHLIKYCLDSYRGDYEVEEDPFISPIFADESLLELLPPVRILVGSMDPLRDDSFQFLKKMVDLKKDIKLTELKYFTHGFLNFDCPMMMTESSVASDIIVEQVRSFLK